MRQMESGDRVRLSICSQNYVKPQDGETVYRFITEEDGFALIVADGDVRHVFPSGLYPVLHCKECGQELPQSGRGTSGQVRGVC